MKLRDTVPKKRALNQSLGAAVAATLAVGLTFWAPLQTSLALARGTGNPTYTRATTATFTDFEGKVTSVLSGEARFMGARRVRNLLGASAGTSRSEAPNLNASGFGASAPTVNNNNTYLGEVCLSASFPVGANGFASSNFLCANTNFGITDGRTYRMRARVALNRALTGSESVQVVITGSQGLCSITFNSSFCPTTFTECASNVGVCSTTGTDSLYGYPPSAVTGTPIIVYVARAQCEDITGQTNQTPSEYVSVGVLSAPFHGANVDGVEYFNTLNGNSISAGVLIEATGAPITTSSAKFANFPGVAGSYYSTPDSASSSITGDIDIRVQVMLADWTPATSQMFVSKLLNVGQYGYDFFMNTSFFPVFRISIDGTVTQTAAATVLTGFVDGTTHWLRVTHSVSTGVTTFYTSENGVTWNALGPAQTTIPVGAIFNGTDQLRIGANSSNPVNGRIYRTQIYNGIAGTLAVDFNPNDGTTVTGGWTSATTGEVWTANGSVTNFTGADFFDNLGNYGYIGELTSTNLILQSEDLATTWTASAATIGSNLVTAPNGLLLADKIQEDNTLASHYVTQTVAKAASSLAYAASFYCKAAERSWCFIQATDGANGAQAWFNLATGAVGTSSTFGAGFAVTGTKTQYVGNGWWRCVLLLTSSAAVTIQQRCCVATGDTVSSYTGTTGNGIYCWGAQLEQQAFASTYQPTTTGSVVRNVDSLTYAMSGNVLDTIGSCSAKIFSFWTTAPVSAMAVVFEDLNGRVLYVGTGSLSTTTSFYDGTNITNSAGLGDMATGQRQRFSRWSGAVSGVGSNTAITVGVFDGNMGGGVTSNIGVLCSPAASGNEFSGCLRDLRIWNRPLSNLEAAAIA